MSSLKTKLTEDMKQAMRAGDKPRLGTVRMALAAIKQREVDERIELNDADITSIIEKMVKQRRESIEQFTAGDRKDLADKEQSEIDVLQVYLPEPLDDAALAKLIDDVVRETGASGMQDMGRVMGQIKQKAAGRVDMGRVSAQIKARLSA